MDSKQFVDTVVNIARQNGFEVEINRNDLIQIDFGNKKLHTKHLEQLYPAILQNGANVGELIDNVAPGRPCTHSPMKQIIAEITA